jgi:2-polyprenyl-3-methyl-5-hydroxy-6-metoxy-1,4-benzoquinol methylase
MEKLVNLMVTYSYGGYRSEMLQYIPQYTKTILDVGCARGEFMALAKKKLGLIAWGIEINSEAAQIAQATLDKVISKDINDALNELPANYFDCIVFNDVLEHLIDPYTLLTQVKNFLTKDGVVIASIPNIRHAPTLYQLLIKGNWDYQEYGVLDKTHLRFFTKKSIKKMFESQGYSLERIDGISCSGSWRTKLLIGAVSDMKYQQFACVAKPILSSQ